MTVIQGWFETLATLFCIGKDRHDHLSNQQRVWFRAPKEEKRLEIIRALEKSKPRTAGSSKAVL
jgi:hypothetical protein